MDEKSLRGWSGSASRAAPGPCTRCSEGAMRGDSLSEDPRDIEALQEIQRREEGDGLPDGVRLRDRALRATTRGEAVTRHG